jgi:hypothetical protein
LSVEARISSMTLASKQNTHTADVKIILPCVPIVATESNPTKKNHSQLDKRSQIQTGTLHKISYIKDYTWKNIGVTSAVDRFQTTIR